MLNDCGLEEGVRNRIVALFSQSGFDSSLGQYQVTTLSGGRAEYSDPLENYWISVILKSGSIYRAGAAGGAIAGSGINSQIEALSDYGIGLGVIWQVIDDCHDILIDRTGKTKKATLPTILYELVRDQRPVQVDVSGQALRHSTGQPSERASKSLADAGIPEIIADILLEWRRRAIQGLQVLEPSPAKNDLVEIIEHVLSSKSILS
jgi:geranylgeranyl pyrophosphate synthase